MTAIRNEQLERFWAKQASPRTFGEPGMLRKGAGASQSRPLSEEPQTKGLAKDVRPLQS